MPEDNIFLDCFKVFQIVPPPFAETFRRQQPVIWQAGGTQGGSAIFSQFRFSNLTEEANGGRGSFVPLSKREVALLLPRSFWSVRI